MTTPSIPPGIASQGRPDVFEAAVSVSDLRVAIDSKQLLDGVNLEVPLGGWLSIIGPNGAGKSTLLHSIAGTLKFTGTVEILGNNIGDIPRSERARRISLVPQTPTIPAGMKLGEYLLLGRSPHLGWLETERSDDIDLVLETLRRLDLLSRESQQLQSLSGGELQRASIGRALVQDAPVMLLDEPTSALDLGHQQEVLELLDQLRHEDDRTIIMTMHDLTLAGVCADRLFLMADGRRIATGEPKQILTEELLQEHYGADVRVLDDGGTIVVVPRIGETIRRDTTI